jgi:hypothetical protein
VQKSPVPSAVTVTRLAPAAGAAALTWNRHVSVSFTAPIGAPPGPARNTPGSMFT